MTRNLCLLLLLAAACSLSSASYPRHDGDKVIAFVPSNLAELQWLRSRHAEEGVPGKLGEKVIFWFGPAPLNRESVVFVPKDAYRRFVSAIPRRSAGLQWWRVQQENLGRVVEAERRENLARASGPLHTRFLRYDEIVSVMNNAAKTCGSFCALENFGTSTEGRNIPLIKIGDTSSRKRIIWIEAGLHAREWITHSTAVYFIDKIVNGYKNKDASITRMLQNFAIYIAPVINPDGYEYTFTNNRFWRKTRSKRGLCSGVDPNRNFGHEWGGIGTSGNSCAETYRGPNAFSEPETQAVRNRVSRDSKRIIAFLDVHSYGQMWMTPYGFDYNQEAANSEQQLRPVRAAAKKLLELGTKYKIGNSAKVIYPAAGAAEDWAHSIGIPYSNCIELPDTGRYGFNMPARTIEPVGKETLEALKEYVRVLDEDNRQRD